MTRRLAQALVRRYPAAWRERYEQEVSGLIDRAYSGEIAVEGRIDIGEIELPVPGAISVTVSYEAS